MELVKLVEYGASPMAAIRAATSDAAKMMGVDGWTGLIAPGKAADFLVLDQNPLENIQSLSQVGEVYLGGRRVLLQGLEEE